MSPLITHQGLKSNCRQIAFQENSVERQVSVKTIDQLARELAGDLQKGSYRARTVAVPSGSMASTGAHPKGCSTTRRILLEP